MSVRPRRSIGGVTSNSPRAGVLDRLRRWAASAEEVEAEELRRAADEHGCAEVAAVPDRARARVAGTLQSVTLQPRAGVPALEADLYDGSDTVTLVWIGRRRISGIDCGRKLVATGRVASVDGRRVMFNPRYDLLPPTTTRESP